MTLFLYLFLLVFQYAVQWNNIFSINGSLMREKSNVFSFIEYSEFFMKNIIYLMLSQAQYFSHTMLTALQVEAGKKNGQ